jgi:hypothetical protein
MGKFYFHGKYQRHQQKKNQFEVKGGLTKTGQILNNSKANNHMFDN